MSYIEQAIQTKSDQWHGDLIDKDYLLDVCRRVIVYGNRLDGIKKALFYGKTTVETFASQGVETCEMLHHEVSQNENQGVDIIHAIIGKVTESIELLEALVGTIEDPFSYIDMTNLLEELGDGQWYDAILANVLGKTFEEAQRINIEKLRARYPNKFNEFDAKNRDLATERVILEQTDSSRVGDLEVVHIERIYATDASQSSGDLAKVLYATTDAQVWAQEFLKVAHGFDGNWQERIDEGMMIGWFANAIENAKMHERAKVEAEYTSPSQEPQ